MEGEFGRVVAIWVDVVDGAAWVAVVGVVAVVDISDVVGIQLLMC